MIIKRSASFWMVLKYRIKNPTLKQTIKVETDAMFSLAREQSFWVAEDLG